MDHPMRYLWDWFNDVNPSGYGWGPIRVSYVEIEAFSRVRNIKVRPWEAELIVDLSILNVEVYHEKKSRPAGMPQDYKPVSSAEGVKAMFSRLNGK